MVAAPAAAFAAAAAAVAAAALFTCAFDGLVLSVSGPPGFAYSVADAASGAPWLEGGGLAVFDGGGAAGGAWLSPGAGLAAAGAPVLGSGEDGALGAYSYLSVAWARNGSGGAGAGAGGAGLSFVANFTCYQPFSLAAFSLSFPDGAVLGLGAEHPATRFPSFSADAGAAVRSEAMGFVEWAGEMSDYGDKHGVGLAGFEGGRQGGPILLFNKSQLELGGPSRPAALLLGPGAGAGTHLIHTVVAVVPGSAAAGGVGSYPVDPGSVVANHTDKVGGTNAPGSGTGLVVQQGNSSACSAACRALGASCDSYVYDTDGFAGDGHNCWVGF